MKFVIGAIVAIAVVFGIMELASNNPPDPADALSTSPAAGQLITPDAPPAGDP